MPEKSEPSKSRPANRAERRTDPRQNVRTIAYVGLGDGNGGIIINISEGGMALAAAQPLEQGCLPKIQFQLPGSVDPIEITAEITWQSESRRQAGIRFVDLPETAQSQIRNWISNGSSTEPPERSGRTPATNANDNGHKSVKSPGKESSAGSAAATAEKEPEPAKVAKEGPRGGEDKEREQSWQESESNANCLPTVADQQSTAAHTEVLQSSASSKESQAGLTAEKRQHVRRDVNEVIYIELGDDNGGLITNISESGAAVQAAKLVAEDQLPNVRFRLKDADSWIDTAGKVVWRGQQRKKQIGIQFVDLPELARRIISEWVAPNEVKQEKPLSPRESAVPIATGHVNVNAAQVRASLPGGQKPFAPLAPEPRPAYLQRSDDRSFNPTTPNAPIAMAESRHLGWPLVAAIIVIIGGLSFAAGMAYAPHADRNKANDLPPIASSTSSPVQSSGPTETPASAPDAKTDSVPAAAGTPGIADAGTGEIKNPVASGAGLENQVPASTTSAADGSPPSPRPNFIAPANPRTSNEFSNSGSQAPSNNPENESAVKANQPPPLTQNPVSDKAAASSRPDLAGPPSVNAQTVPSARSGLQPTPPENTAAAGEDAPAAPTIPPNVTGTVAGTSRFRSIRVPAGFRLQTSQAGNTLQIGQLSYNPAPPYPADALQQHLEGTVKLHAIVGPDGGIQSLETISGPPALVSAALPIVRTWRYGQTSLGGRVIGAEQDITVVFRLANSTSRPN